MTPALAPASTPPLQEAANLTSSAPPPGPPLQEAANLTIRCLTRAWEKGAGRKAAVRVAASVLAKAAMDRGSKDNITVVIVDLKSNAEGAAGPPPPPPPPQLNEGSGGAMAASSSAAEEAGPGAGVGAGASGEVGSSNGAAAFPPAVPELNSSDGAVIATSRTPSSSETQSATRDCSSACIAGVMAAVLEKEGIVASVAEALASRQCEGAAYGPSLGPAAAAAVISINGAAAPPAMTSESPGAAAAATTAGNDASLGGLGSGHCFAFPLVPTAPPVAEAGPSAGTV